MDPDELLQSQEGGGTLKFRKKPNKIPPEPKRIPVGDPPIAHEELLEEQAGQAEGGEVASPEDIDTITEPQTEETVTTDSQPTAEMEVCIEPPANGHVAHL